MFDKSAFFAKANSDDSQDFDLIRIGIAGPEMVKSWSYGEVTKPETINYRTFKPEKSGLFCSKTFGPTKDYECLCGRYKRVKHKGVVCHKCGVEVTVARVRRERMGHIALAAPVAHVWFLRSLPSRIGLLVNMSLKDLERVLYFESHVIVSSTVPSIEKGSLVSEDEVYALQDQFGADSFVASIGGEAVEGLLKEIDLVSLRSELHANLNNCGTELKRRKLLKRLKVVDQFLESGNKPEWMMIRVLPVLPPQLRPLVPLDGGRFATSDLNDLYRRVLNRNNRLKRLIELKAPDIIIRNEKRMLQEAVDALLDNGRGDRMLKNSGKRPLKSIADMLKGKHGRFRQNLLGKRVDYSGRSVIVVGPKLKLHECGIPKGMALELFKPFVYAKLVEYGIANTIKAAKRMLEGSRPEVWDVLEEVIKEHPVLLNRAPTLHRLGVQAFEPVLAEGQAIQLHPLVCAAFNADFDGDQMAVHVPLSIEAQVESRVLMMSTNNILSPANGNPVILPEQDIVLGLYYLTIAIDDLGGSKPAFSSMYEVEYAMEFGKVSLHSRILYRLKGHDGSTSVVETTPGRLKVFEALPSHPQLTFDMINKLLSKKDLSKVIQAVRGHCGPKATVVFADKLMELGFRYSYRAGLSWGMEDMIVPSSRASHVETAMKAVEEFKAQYQEGLITQGEKCNKVIDVWLQCTEKVTNDLTKALSFKDGEVKSIKDINSIYIMSDSGARGSTTQIKQISGMRGLMSKPSGEILETPILSNFKEGLTVLEYFNSTHGARKGLADTALKTANSGYLTRRLVDVSLDCVVLEYDCGTQEGLLMSPLVSDGRVITPMSERVFGRVLLADVSAPDGTLILAKGGMVEEAHVDQIERARIPALKVRSVLTCAAKEGVCAKCYGRDLSTGNLVSPGEAVGVIAAQSIGEPGTQLTMKTFHIGGAASGVVESSSIEAAFAGKLKVISGNMCTNSHNQNVVLSGSCELAILGEGGIEVVKYHVPYGAVILAEGQVEVGTKLAEWDPYNVPIIADCAGKVSLVDVIDGSTAKSVLDNRTGLVRKTITESKAGSSLSPRVEVIPGKGPAFVRYLAANAVLLVSEGDLVQAGDLLARLPRGATRSRDITGGLPKVIELVEARKPKEPSIIAEFDGLIEFGKDYKNKRVLILRSSEGGRSIEYIVPRGRQILVSDGELVNKGKTIVDGQIALQDMLRVDGIEELAKYVISEIQSVYMLQGVKINDKHIEIIIKQMLQKVKIVDAGDSVFFVGEKVDKKEFDRVNAKLASHSMRQAAGELVISGITKAATQTNSFISSAAFQETTRVLTEAAIAGRVDELRSIKENVITGRLIPAGTGFYTKKFQGELKVSDPSS